MVSLFGLSAGSAPPTEAAPAAARNRCVAAPRESLKAAPKHYTDIIGVLPITSGSTGLPSSIAFVELRAFGLETRQPGVTLLVSSVLFGSFPSASAFFYMFRDA
jgi:hypothetical protein